LDPLASLKPFKRIEPTESISMANSRTAGLSSGNAYERGGKRGGRFSMNAVMPSCHSAPPISMAHGSDESTFSHGSDDDVDAPSATLD
jgi:hypothetical protein